MCTRTQNLQPRRILRWEQPARCESTAGLVLVDASHEDQPNEVPQMARFVPLLSTLGVFRPFDVSFGQRVESLPPSVRQFAQATRFLAAGYPAAPDELIHVQKSAKEVRSPRRCRRGKGLSRVREGALC